MEVKQLDHCLQNMPPGDRPDSGVSLAGGFPEFARRPGTIGIQHRLIVKRGMPVHPGNTGLTAAAVTVQRRPVIRPAHHQTGGVAVINPGPAVLHINDQNGRSRLFDDPGITPPRLLAVTA